MRSIWDLGDSRGLLCSNGQAVFATKDHKPINPNEKERIEKAGSEVIGGRVDANLAMSRGKRMIGNCWLCPLRIESVFLKDPYSFCYEEHRCELILAIWA